MSVQLLDKTRKINKLLHNSNSSKVVFNDICQVLMETLSSNILVLSKKGKVLGVSLCPGVEEITELMEDKVGGYVDPLLNERFLGVLSTKENVNPVSYTHLKLIPVHRLIKDKSLLMIDDSIVRGTQLRETTEFLYSNGAKEVHIRPACPPLLYGCKYLNFSRSKSEMDLITRRTIARREGENVDDKVLQDYANPDSTNYKEMLEDIRKELNFTSLKYHRLDDLTASIGISPCKLCTYCWSGKE